MSCLVCGNGRTVRSHLIPRALAAEVQVGKEHVFVRGPNDYRPTQSGIFEKNILCEKCDNGLSQAENIATQTFRKIRAAAKTATFGEYVLGGVRGDDVLRFVAGLLWKHSVASPQYGKIDLGTYQSVFRDIAFRRAYIPRSVDALIIRLKCHPSDDGVFAYRTPKPDRKEGVNGYRFLVGGVFIFAKVDQRTPKGGPLERASIRNEPDLPYVVMGAQNFEEYGSAARLGHSGALSGYLDRQGK